MIRTADSSGNAPERKTGKRARRQCVTITTVIRPVPAEEFGALLAKYLREYVEPDPRVRALQCDASAMRPGDVLIAHMQGLEAQGRRGCP